MALKAQLSTYDVSRLYVGVVILGKKLNIQNSGHLDPHKQAAAICLAALDVYPLSNLSEPVEKKKEFYFPNEFIAMKIGRFHVRLSISEANPSAPNTLIGLYRDLLVYDQQPYDNNFIYMLYEEKQLGLHSGEHNYLALSKLFYHFDIDLKRSSKQK